MLNKKEGGHRDPQFSFFLFSKKLGHVADRYGVEKISTSGLDSQFLFPTKTPLSLCPGDLSSCLFFKLSTVVYSKPIQTETPSPLPRCCASTTPCDPPTAAQRPSVQVRLSTWHCELPASRNCVYSLPYPQCSAQCLGTSSTQCIILTVYLKAKHFSLWNPKSTSSHYHFQVAVNDTGKITFENKS